MNVVENPEKPILIESIENSLEINDKNEIILNNSTNVENNTDAQMTLEKEFMEIKLSSTKIYI